MQEKKRFGYTGKSLSVNLSGIIAPVFDTPLDLCSHFIGGRGLGVSFIRDSIHKSFDDPEMPLICATGPLVGTEAPTSGRFSVVSRSPLTNTVFDCSVGGKFATDLKRAGYDFITISGSSENWVLINIKDHEVSIEDGSLLTGKKSF